MTNSAVIGLGFGDEGKGVVTEYLCSQDPENTIVVRFSGGQQAAHTVFKRDTQHIFHHFGSGTLSGCPTYWSEHCTFNPWTWWTEFKTLVEKHAIPKFYVNPLCPVTTFYDMYPSPDSPEVQHGTCGHGIFRTKQRSRLVPFTILDVLTWEPKYLDHKMHHIQSFYGVEELDHEVYWSAVCSMRTRLNSELFIIDRPPYAKNLVFEGSQGLMLDEHIGYMPHCTPSDITPRNAIKMASLDEIYLVTRCYQTRHGNGPMTNENYPVSLINNENETCKFNKFQGEFRSTVLDLDQLIHAKEKGIDGVILKGTKINLVVTCIDQLEEYSLTLDNEKLNFASPEQFARFIAKELDINGGLYINNSPYSNLQLL